jgi:beta-N-acetylhexosaminidase
MVWPTVLGDYTSGDSPQWQHLTDYIRREKVGGFTISVGSPTEVASKLNALQEMSSVPLVFGADLEAGAGFRAPTSFRTPSILVAPWCFHRKWRSELPAIPRWHTNRAG